MNITVIGTGYVGLTTAVSLAMQGHLVTGVDVDKDKIALLKQGICPIYEPGLAENLARLLEQESLQFVISGENGASVRADVIFICVGTPSDANGHADLAYLNQVVDDLQLQLQKDRKEKVLVIKSTVPVGTTDQVAQLFHGQRHVHVVSNPEFLREGNALEDALAPNRIVIGADSPFAFDTMDRLYAEVSAPVIRTSRANAEMIKYASNAFLATRISFMNELARLCEKVGAEVTVVAKGMGLDSRIGPEFLRAGLGYGGSCFPKDTLALLQLAKEHQMDLSILQSVIAVNNSQPEWFVHKLVETFSTLQNKTFALLGVTFKPDTDDIREAPSLKLMHSLLAKGALVTAYDPIAVEKAKALLPAEVRFATTPYEAVEGADAVLLVTEWKECVEADWAKIRLLVKQPYIFDGRNVLPRATLKRLGFQYSGVGILGHAE